MRKSASPSPQRLGGTGEGVLTQRFDHAFLLAAHLHRGQQRKFNGTPYMAHLMSVAALVLEDGGVKMRRSRPSSMMRLKTRVDDPPELKFWLSLAQP